MDMTELITEETPEAVTVTFDYTPYLQSVIENQQTEIELLEYQNEILLEQINGLSLISNYMNTFIMGSVLVIIVVICWKVISGWFFRDL